MFADKGWFPELTTNRFNIISAHTDCDAIRAARHGFFMG